MNEGNMQRDERGGNYNEAREFSRYNSAANDNRRQGMGGGRNYYDNNDDGKSFGSNGNGNMEARGYHDTRDFARDSERRGNFGRDQRDRETMDYHRSEQPRSYNDSNGFREFRHPNDNDYHPSRYSTERSNNFQHGSGRRDEYSDRGERHEFQRAREPEPRWQGHQPMASRGKDSYNTNDRPDLAKQYSGMNERNWEGTERRSSEWSTKRPEDVTRGYSKDDRSRPNNSHNDIQRVDTSRGKFDSEKIRENENVKSNSYSEVLHSRREGIPSKASSSENDRDKKYSKKREREDNDEALALKLDVREIEVVKNSSVPATNLKEGPTETKKVKLTSATNNNDSDKMGTSNQNSVKKEIESKMEKSKTDTKTMPPSKSTSGIAAPSLQRKLHDKPNTKSIPVKAASSSIQKPKIQAKPKVKPTNKLGIPMRWLKPKAKPKPPVKKVLPKPPEDTSKSTKIPLKQQAGLIKKATLQPSSPSNRLVTDSSETSSSLSVQSKKQKSSNVPTAIVTKKKAKKKPNPKPKKTEFEPDDEPDDEPEDVWNSEAESEESDDDGSDSETDDDEVLDWASKMLGVPASPSSIQPTESNDSVEANSGKGDEESKAKSPKLKIRLSAALKLKLTESAQSNIEKGGNGLSKEDDNKLEAALKKLERRKKKREKMKALSEKINDERPEFDQERAKMEIEEERRKREEAKPLTAKELRKILRDDTFSGGGNQNNWVRRSRRQPNMNLLNSKPVRILVDKLKHNDIDMRVLKMKKFINDPNTPCAVIDAILNAMEENTNCEALYIQNFNEGMRDEQVLHLLRILQQPSCNIWCLNVGENYNVSDETWERFTKGLMHTKITHMYASEHTITSDMKDEIRFTIRENREKHDMHINPNNLDVIIQCTHCWWNPINAKVLRPYLKKKGYEHVLKDKEGQGLQGSKSMAPTS